MIQIRTSPIRRAAATAAVLAAAGGLLAIGCGGDTETTTTTTAATLASSSEASETTTTSTPEEATTVAEDTALEPAATASATVNQAGDRYGLDLSVYPLERQGDLSLLRMTLEVRGKGSLLFNELGATGADYDLSGVTLIADGKRYLVATDSADACACSEFSGLYSGTYELSAIVAAPPEEIDEVTLQFPGLFGAITALPVS